MMFVHDAFALRALLSFAALVLPSLDLGLPKQLFAGQAQADPATTPEKEAFEAAKELGTLDAWQAFLNNYPTGFHADLARAYVKKLEDNKPSSTTTSSNLTEFPTAAGSWGGIVRDREGQQYNQIDSLPEGAPVSLMGKTETLDNGYPWFKIWYGPDGEKKGYMWGGILCSTGAERPDLYKTCPTGPTPVKATPPSQPVPPAPPVKSAVPLPVGCAYGYVAINGRCIKKRDTASFCGPGFHAQGGKCVPGFVPPKKLSTEQIKGLFSGCPKGQVWNKAEGCHEDD